MNPDQNPDQNQSSLIWVNIIAVHATKVHKQMREQTAIVMSTVSQKKVLP